jgi:hypothetical protein
VYLLCSLLSIFFLLTLALSGLGVGNSIEEAMLTPISGEPMAVVWNYAIHGTCLFWHSMVLSGDIMGRANMFLEEKV